MSNSGIDRNSNGGILRRVRRIYIVSDFWVAPSDHQENWPVDVTVVSTCNGTTVGGGIRDNVYGIGAGQRIAITVGSTSSFGTFLSATYGSASGGGPEAISYDKSSVSSYGMGPFNLPWGAVADGGATGNSSTPTGVVIVDYLTLAPWPGGRYGIEGFANNRSGL